MSITHNVVNDNYGFSQPAYYKMFLNRKYDIILKYLQQDEILHPNEGKCKVENCKLLAKTSGFCNKHYKRFKKYGNPNLTKIQLGYKKYKLIIDDG